MNEQKPNNYLVNREWKRFRKFQLDLEFLQMLANPTYVSHLVAEGYLHQKEFKEYLRYLKYLKAPEFIMFIKHPEGLRYLELLQQPEYVNLLEMNITFPQLATIIMKEQAELHQQFIQSGRK